MNFQEMRRSFSRRYCHVERKSDISNFSGKWLEILDCAWDDKEEAASLVLDSQRTNHFRPSREYGLKIWTLFFPRNHANIDVLEAGVFQKLV